MRRPGFWVVAPFRALLLRNAPASPDWAASAPVFWTTAPISKNLSPALLAFAPIPAALPRPFLALPRFLEHCPGLFLELPRFLTGCPGYFGVAPTLFAIAPISGELPRFFFTRNPALKLLPWSKLRYFDDKQGKYGQNFITVKANGHVRHIPVEIPPASVTADPGLGIEPFVIEPFVFDSTFIIHHSSFA